MLQSYFTTLISLFFFFFNDPATTEIYTLSLHDALPISRHRPCKKSDRNRQYDPDGPRISDRKSTRLNSSHVSISYAVFCLKKKKKPTGARSTRWAYLSSYGRSAARPRASRSSHSLAGST